MPRPQRAFAVATLTAAVVIVASGVFVDGTIARPAPCLEEGAEPIASSRTWHVVKGGSRLRKGEDTASRLVACRIRDGRRFTILREASTQDGGWIATAVKIVDDRYIAYERADWAAETAWRTPQVFDTRHRRLLHDGRCQIWHESEDGVDSGEVRFLPGGRMAYSCTEGGLRLADRQGDRWLEPAGSDVRRLTFARGRLSWTLVEGRRYRRKSMPIPPRPCAAAEATATAVTC